MKSLHITVLFVLVTLCLISFSFCESTTQAITIEKSTPDTLISYFTGYRYKVNDRTEILRRLKEKTGKKLPLVVHIMVPMCDNENQGIVPVNRWLGDGRNLKTNLYWGAGYGVKSYFKKQGWKILSSKIDSTGKVMERVIFYKKQTNGMDVYLVADAYRGDRMKECLHDYFRSLGGWKSGLDSIPNQKLLLYKDADLIIFNGHDGLMDDTLKEYYSKDSIPRETATIACYAKSFFNPRFEECGAFPLVGTSGLLAPEAYVMEAVIEKWLLQKSELEIKNAAGDAYHAKHPSTSTGGARALFTTGW